MQVTIMQPKLAVYICVLIFFVFEVIIYYFYHDNTWTIREVLSKDLANAELINSTLSSSADWNSPLVEAGVLCSQTMFNQTRLNASSCVCLTDNESLVLRQFNLDQLIAYIRNNRQKRFECAMTVSPSGRLGNLMGEYATLYALAKLNNRPAFLLRDMAQTLRAYFDVSMPTLTTSANEELEYMWTNVEVRQWMEPSYAHFNEMFVKITGYPNSWTFYEDFRDDIIREFTFHDEVLRRIQSVFRNMTLEFHSQSNSSITFVGVHVRRTDAIGWIRKYHGRVADKTFFRKAMDHFRQNYLNVVFVVASDDMAWCRKNIFTTHDDVFFVGEGNVNNPIHDFALLANCNHSIISIGTYGYWSAYLAGGDTIYFANYTSADSEYLKKFTYETMYLPNWKGIS